MEKNRKSKIFVILSLLVAIASVSIGFAAFSTTLNISSSASVSPSSSSFSLGFYPSQIPTLDDATVSPVTSGGATGNNVTLSPAATTLTGLKANFTEPGQTVEYSFYVGNESEYDAFLRAINFLNVNGKSSNKVCTPGTGASASLVEATCDAITMLVEVNGTGFRESNSNVSGFRLQKGRYIPVSVLIMYDEDGARADGPFTVEFGGIALEYSTVDSDTNLIQFTLDDITCYAEEGMTWAEWIESDYNTMGVYIEGKDVYLNGTYVTMGHGAIQMASDVIFSGEIYLPVSC